jgi:hypothetical protein
MMALPLSGGKLKVLLCIFYYAYVAKGKDEKKGSCNVTIDAIMRHTNISRQSVMSSIKWLQENNFLTRVKSSTDSRTFEYALGPDIIEFQSEEAVFKRKPKNKVTKGLVSFQEAKEKELPKGERYKYVDVEEWNQDDFGFYLKHRVLDLAKNNKIDMSEFVVKLSGGVARSSSLSTIMFNLSQACNNNYIPFMMKAYFDWYVDERLLKILRSKSEFSLGFLEKTSNVKAFLKAADISRKTVMNTQELEEKLVPFENSFRPKIKKMEKVSDVDKKSMDECYEYGMPSMLSEFGIVLAGNYLIKFKGQSFKDSAVLIGNFMKSLNINHSRQKSLLIKITKKTYEMYPYNKGMKFLNWEKIYARTLADLSDDIECYKSLSLSSNEESYRFLLNE